MDPFTLMALSGVFDDEANDAGSPDALAERVASLERAVAVAENPTPEGVEALRAELAEAELALALAEEADAEEPSEALEVAVEVPSVVAAGVVMMVIGVVVGLVVLLIVLAAA